MSGRMWTNWTSLHCWGDCNTAQPLWKTAWQIPKMLHIDYHECVHAQLLQLCLTFCHPMDCSLPGSSVHGIFHARMLEWVATDWATFTFMKEGVSDRASLQLCIITFSHLPIFCDCFLMTSNILLCNNFNDEILFYFLFVTIIYLMLLRNSN